MYNKPDAAMYEIICSNTRWNMAGLTDNCRAIYNGPDHGTIISMSKTRYKIPKRNPGTANMISEYSKVSNGSVGSNMKFDK